jgi:hypothetical protein
MKLRKIVWGAFKAAIIKFFGNLEKDRSNEAALQEFLRD